MDLPSNRFGTLNVIAYVHVRQAGEYKMSGKDGGPGGFHGSPIVSTPKHVRFIPKLRTPSLSILDLCSGHGF